MRLPASAHTSRPWRIHEIAPDFRIEDVWALPTPGGPRDFPRLIELITSMDPSQSSSRASRALFAMRWKLGELFGLDDAAAETLEDRLPEDLRSSSPGAQRFETLPFEPLYLLDDEWAAEIANRTMHGVIHVGWVEDETAAGGYRGQMAILVRPNGLLGRAYMAAIAPFRHLIIYPRMTSEVGRKWRALDRVPTSGPAHSI